MITPVELVQKFYAALSTGDIPTILTVLDPDLEWTEAERFPYYGGTWHSPQAVIDNLLMPLGRDWEDFSAKVDDFIAQDNRVVSFGTYSGITGKLGVLCRRPLRIRGQPVMDASRTLRNTPTRQRS